MPPAMRDYFPRGQNINLRFNSNIENFLLKNQWGKDRNPDFVILLVWSPLIVREWVVVLWSRKVCLGPAEIPSFVLRVLLNYGRRRVRPRYYLFACDINQGMRRR